MLDKTIYPESMDAGDLHDFVQDIHYNPCDFDEGNISNRIWEFKKYHLRRLPVSSLSANYALHDDLVEAYQKLNAESMPPLVWNPVERDMIDGCNRLEALRLSGVETVLVYVGDEATYERCQEEEEED